MAMLFRCFIKYLCYFFLKLKFTIMQFKKLTSSTKFIKEKSIHQHLSFMDKPLQLFK